MGWTDRLLVAVMTISLMSGCSPSVGQVPPPSVPITAKPIPSAMPLLLDVPKPMVQTAPVTVKVHLRFGDTWLPVSPMSSFISAGGGEVRLTFSKPVPALEVEKVLNEMQQTPVRGRILWEDDRTLIWQIAAFPQRLDFLLDGVYDLDGIPLPGGIPSILTGEPPQLVELDLVSLTEKNRAVLPPDIAFASLSESREVVNFHSWRPGLNQWDWGLVAQHLNLTTWRIGSGVIEGSHPRLSNGIEDWQISPDRSLVAGFRIDQSSRATADSSWVDLVVTNLRGGRQSISAGFVTRLQETQGASSPFHLSWSPDSRQVVALSHRPGDSSRSDLVVYEVSTGTRSVLMADLPVSARSARVSWSSDGSRILVGNLVVNLAAQQTMVLNGNPELSRGIWEPDGTRLLYTLEDWDEVMIVHSGVTDLIPIGRGLIIDWIGPGRVALIRWPGSDFRYLPPGWKMK